MPLSPSILLTGFEPFDGEPVNPSWEVARRLEGEVLEGRIVATACLPVTFGAALETLRRAIAEVQPEVVLCLGQARGLTGLSLERVALNLDDARIPDNAGQQPVDRPVIPGAPMAYLSSLPVKAILARLTEEGIPAHLSHSAGTFLCNHVFYGLAHLIATEQPALRGGFIHLPLLPSQAARLKGEPSMAVKVMAQGVRLALLAALTTPVDLAVPGGALHGSPRG